MSEATAPKTAADLQAFSAEILDKLVARYVADRERFIDADLPDTGLIYRCAGSVSLLLLVNGFEKLASNQSWQGIVRREFAEVCDCVHSMGFDATPMVTSQMTEGLFSPKAAKRYHYLDSVSWVLSFSTLLRLTQRKKRIDLEPSQSEKISKMIKETIEILVDSACPQGGWGFSSGCSSPDLYFSYAVSEALADVGDYVFGETPTIADKDVQICALLGDELIGRVGECRSQAVAWLKEKYVPLLGKQEIPSLTSPDKDDYVHLYNSFFVLDMLVVNNAHLDLQWDKIRKALEHGIYLSRIDMDRAYADKKWWDSPKKSSLTIEWLNHPDKSAAFAQRIELSEPSLVPLSLRCNTLYSYYVAMGEDQKIHELFRLVCDNRNESTGLWDSLSYSLLITERAIEAIVDYNDYLTEYTPVLAAQREFEAGPVEQAIRAAVRQELESRLELQATGSVAPAQNAERSGAGSVVLREGDLLRLFTSALAMGSQVNRGKKVEEGFQFQYQHFVGEVRHLLRSLFEKEMQDAYDPSGKDKYPAEQGAANVEALKQTFANWLKNDNNYDLADMFVWAVDQVAKDKAVNTAGMDASLKKSGRKR